MGMTLIMTMTIGNGMQMIDGVLKSQTSLKADILIHRTVMGFHYN